MAAAQPTFIEKCLLHTLEVTNQCSAPISRQVLFNDFMKTQEGKRCRTYLNNKITEMLSVMATMSGVSVEEKARWMFATSTPFTESKNKYELKFNEGLRKLKEDIEDSGVAVFNGRNQIIKYSDKKGNLKFEGVHSLLTGTNKNLRKYKKQAKKVPKVRKLTDVDNDSSEDEDADSTEVKAPAKKASSSRALKSRKRASKKTKTPVKKVRKSVPKLRKLIETSSEESDGEEEAQKAPQASKRRRLIESSSEESDEGEEVQEAPRKTKTPSTPRPNVPKSSKTPVKMVRKSAPKRRRLIESSSDESDVEQEEVRKAPSTPRSEASKSTKTPIQNVRFSAPLSRKLIETSSEESDFEEDIIKTPPATKRRWLIESSSEESGEKEEALKAPLASKNPRKRLISTSRRQEATVVSNREVEEASNDDQKENLDPEEPLQESLEEPVPSDKAEEASNEVQQENFDPADTQPIQESPEEPASKRMCVDDDEVVVLKRIANIKPEIDDDIIFEGIVVKEKKPSSILLYKPSILGGMYQCEELLEEEEEPRNIHTLGFLNCLKEFLIKVFGIGNEEAMEMQEEFSRLIQKGEMDPNFMAMDVSRLYAVLDDNLSRLAVEATNKGSGDDQLDFAMVLDLLKDSCHSKMTPELGKDVIEMIEEQIDYSQEKQEMISWDSILEVMRRVMLDIKH